MSIGYNSLRTKEEKDYSKYKNEVLECIYSFDFERLNKILSTSKLNHDGNLIFDTICNIFNPVMHKKLLNSELRKLKSIEQVIACDFSRNELSFNFKNIDFKIKKITKNIVGVNQRNSGKNTFNISNNIYEIIQLSKQLKQPNKIVIGYLTEELDKIQKLHCWIEYDKDSKTYVIDYPHNLVMNKEGYYLLTQPKIINKINSDDLDNQVIDLLNNLFQLEYDEIMCFYQEFEKDLKK